MTEKSSIALFHTEAFAHIPKFIWQDKSSELVSKLYPQSTKNEPTSREVIYITPHPPREKSTARRPLPQGERLPSYLERRIPLPLWERSTSGALSARRVRGGG